GLAVEAAGPLVVPAAEAWTRELCPATAERPGAPPVVAFLADAGGGPVSDLYAAPLRVDPATGDPRVDRAEARLLARGCRRWAPTFAPDGRAVYILRGAE